MNPYKNQNLNKLLDKFTTEFIEKKIVSNQKKTQQLIKNLFSSSKLEKCFMCGLNMNSFIESKACFHLFIYPSGIKKRIFEKYLQNPIVFLVRYLF